VTDGGGGFIGRSSLGFFSRRSFVGTRADKIPSSA